MASGQKPTKDLKAERKGEQNDGIYGRDDGIWGGALDYTGGFGFWQGSLSVEQLVLTDQSSTSSRRTMQYTEVIDIHVYTPIHTFTSLRADTDAITHTHARTQAHTHTHTHTQTHTQRFTYTCLLYIHMFPAAISTALQPN